MRNPIRAALCLALVLVSCWLSACASDDGRAGMGGRLERADRAQGELSRETGGR